jgi:hypothetical protein
VSDRRSAADLGPSAEAVLGAFPVPERDWERDARAIEARLAASDRRSTDAACLSPPLPTEPGEPGSVSPTTTPPANSEVRPQSLAELARRSLEKKQSGERERAQKSLAIAAQEPPNENELPAPRAALHAPIPAREGARSRPSPARPTSVAGASGAPRAWPKLALGISALCVAAALLFWRARPEPSPVAGTTPVSPSATQPTAALATGEVGKPGPAANGAKGGDPSALPSEPLAKAAEFAGSEPSASAAAEPVAAVKSGPAGHVAAGKGVLTDEQSKAGALPGHDGHAQNGLPPDPALRPADSSGGDMPTKPSSGAVQAALGSVMSGARHCVAGALAPSSAVVLFGSDGRVQQVSVTGPAAGTSAAACIEAQLSRARVQPFAATNFSVSATVRPD